VPLNPKLCDVMRDCNWIWKKGKVAMRTVPPENADVYKACMVRKWQRGRSTTNFPLNKNCMRSMVETIVCMVYFCTKCQIQRGGVRCGLGTWKPRSGSVCY
jgi:hypothetical protein